MQAKFKAKFSVRVKLKSHNGERFALKPKNWDILMFMSFMKSLHKLAEAVAQW